MIRVPEQQIEAVAVALMLAERGVLPDGLAAAAAALTEMDRAACASMRRDAAIAAIRAATHPPQPANLEAEQALLGAVMYDNAAFERLPDGLREDSFHEPFHGRLWVEIETLIRKGQLADPALLMDRFRDDDAFHAFGGLRYLADLVDRAPPAANALDYGRAVMEMSRRRALIRIAGDLAYDAQDAAVEVTDAASTAEGGIFSLMEAGRSGGGVVSFSEALTGALHMAAAAYERDGKLAGLATQLVDLDQKLGGLHPSDLLILAGRPSMGKTALATNIAFNVARRYRWTPDPDAPAGRRTVEGGVVMFYSLEMSAEQLAMRILAETSGIASDRLRKGEIDATDYGRLREAAVEFAEAPIYIDATGGLSIAKMAARARRQKRLTGLDLIVVDYLQLATTSNSRQGANRVEQVSEITGALKALAKELNVPVLALSQLSRQVEQREDKRPQLSDLRESGSIEQDADAVMFVYRESYYLERAEPKEGTDEHLTWQQSLDVLKNQAEVIIGKQRHGPIGSVKLAFDADITRFGNLAKDGWSGAYHDPSTPRSQYS